MFETVCITSMSFSKAEELSNKSESLLWTKKQLQRVIHRLVELGYKKFILSLSFGIELAAAEMVIEMKKAHPEIKIISALPYHGYEEKWGMQQLVILQQSNKIMYVSDPGYAGYKLQFRNEWMIRQSAVVVAIWDGKDTVTQKAVQYALRAKQKPSVIQINPATKKIIKEK